MKKRYIIIAIVLVAMFMSISAAATNTNPLLEIGAYFRDFQNSKNLLIDDGKENLAAEYHESKITKAELEFRKRIQGLLDGESSEKLSDHQVIDVIVKGIMQVEEAERLGISATQAEIDSMMQEQKRNYEIPEVKEYLDDHCKGAEITIEEYFSYLEQHAPIYISRQKLQNKIGEQFCAENGLEFTNINPPQEMLDAIDAYIEELFEAHKGEIVYYIDN